MGRRVCVVGVGYEGFRPVVSDLSTRELMFEAASKAYEDASIDPRKEVDSFVCCTEDLWEGWSITDEMVPDQIGAAGRPLCTIPADAITGLGTVVMHILSGIAEVAVLEAHSKSSDVLTKEAVEELALEPSTMRPLGLDTDVLAALEMDGFLRASGHSRGDLDRLVVSSKRRAMRNPRASFGARLEQSEVSSSEALAEPLRRLDKAQFAEAGVVLVLASEEWAEENRRDPVYVDGVAWSSSLPWFDGGAFVEPGYAAASYARATKMAGLKRDLDAFDIVEADDTYSYKLLQHVEALSRDSEEANAILAGKSLNPSGGSLGVGNLLEASALHRLLECVLQLRGEAGASQVRRARTALVQSWRGVPTATGGVAVLSR